MLIARQTRALVGESPVIEVQRISYTGNSPFVLSFAGMTTASIEVGTTEAATAGNIKRAPMNEAKLHLIILLQHNQSNTYFQ